MSPSLRPQNPACNCTLAWGNVSFWTPIGDTIQKFLRLLQTTTKPAEEPKWIHKDSDPFSIFQILLVGLSRVQAKELAGTPLTLPPSNLYTRTSQWNNKQHWKTKCLLSVSEEIIFCSSTFSLLRITRFRNGLVGNMQQLEQILEQNCHQKWSPKQGNCIERVLHPINSVNSWVPLPRSLRALAPRAGDSQPSPARVPSWETWDIDVVTEDSS